MNVTLKISTLMILGLVLSACTDQKNDQWNEDFKYQPVAIRPALEVTYTDSSRTAFQILAEEYQLTGQLEKPHLLLDQQMCSHLPHRNIRSPFLHRVTISSHTAHLEVPPCSRPPFFYS